ncbi:MAG: type I DNA topoisomerase [Bacteroidales bacterium]|nr:type I DNA topoisomerase [Bacteroidales bacterium]
MMKNLVIVESPAKAKTIEKFLGPDYKVMSSVGHIRDLKSKGMSVEIDKDFSPIYEVPAEKKDVVRALKTEAAKADTVWLASDEDREGEAIAWHLAEVLGLDPAKTNRIVFHEITKPAILEAIANPRHIDLDRVNAQQARRVLDRIVGFELSPVLWKKIKPALSAGRVQSVAVRLICEREKEIDNFTPEPYFRVTGLFNTPEGEQIKAELKHRVENQKEAHNLLALAADNSEFQVSEVGVKPIKRSPTPPFTTSTLQQEAGKRLGFSVKQTMRTAQKLYEEGRITYMRTDSTNLSALALRDIKSVVEEDYGKNYHKERHYHTHSKGAQEAHEAIRPTYISQRDIPGDERERKLYDLIWKRAVASQMSDALLEKTNIDIEMRHDGKGTGEEFRAEGEVITFEGFMKAYGSDSSDNSGLLPKVEKGDILSVKNLTATERFTLPPARYTEASLVKKMEDLGIGRPSTYAPTISTIQDRDYIRHGEKRGEPRDYVVLTLADGKINSETLTEMAGSEKGKLIPTDVGMVVNDFLTANFPDILDYNFTARVEEKFDEIAEGKLGWKNEMAGFYGDFHPHIDRVNSMRTEHKVGERLLGTDPETGNPVSVKIGRFGPIVQIGEATDEEKPRFASLNAGQSIYDITLEDALKLFELPRTLGEWDGAEVKAAIGRFGPYVQIGKEYVSIPKEMTPQTITLEEAIQLITAKREADANRIIKTFDEMPGLEILNGRFGPYIAYKKEGDRKATNYKIPKGTDPASLSLEEVKAIMEAPAPAKKRTTTARKKKS